MCIKRMIRKFIIWVFRLQDISDDIRNERKKQEAQDEKYWKSKMKELEDHLDRKHSLEMLDFEIEVRKKDDEINKLKSREKELDNREYEIKKLIKEDSYVAEDMYNKVMDMGKSIMKHVGEIGKIKDSALDLKKRIE
jgi:vacuolar-type H+-ATPase subunit I/STV1